MISADVTNKEGNGIEQKTQNKQDKENDSQRRKTHSKTAKTPQKGDGNTSGPLDKFLIAARNRTDTLLTPKGKGTQSKTRTPPSTSKEDEKAKREKKNAL